MCCISEASTLTTVVILIPFYLGVRLHYHLRQTDSPTPPPHAPHQNYFSGSFSCSQPPNPDQILTELGTVLPFIPFKIYLVLPCCLRLGL